MAAGEDAFRDFFPELAGGDAASSSQSAEEAVAALSDAEVKQALDLRGLQYESGDVDKMRQILRENWSQRGSSVADPEKVAAAIEAIPGKLPQSKPAHEKDAYCADLQNRFAKAGFKMQVVSMKDYHAARNQPGHA
eukprot:TRINITY_DN14925_c0_g1_i2.p2 TRINITY_DN14925_c0_g1~~TRINITY_DN14925_c0_g1_i2.p2  ORF type:complete len:136 (-),score=38.20 TRINITY_DN14925_c0_g1_i2:256-663(-)